MISNPVPPTKEEIYKTLHKLEYIEDDIRNATYWRIGWAIKHMNRWQRILWAVTGYSKYMKTKFWGF